MFAHFSTFFNTNIIFTPMKVSLLMTKEDGVENVFECLGDFYKHLCRGRKSENVKCVRIRSEKCSDLCSNRVTGS